MIVGVNQQESSVPFYNTKLDIARKYLRSNVLNYNSNNAFTKEAKSFVGFLGYKWPCRLNGMLDAYLVGARSSGIPLTQNNFSYYKTYFASKGFSLWEITEFFRAFQQEKNSGAIDNVIAEPWTYDPQSEGSIYTTIAKYALIGLFIYVAVPASIKAIGNRNVKA